MSWSHNRAAARLLVLAAEELDRDAPDTIQRLAAMAFARVAMDAVADDELDERVFRRTLEGHFAEDEIDDHVLAIQEEFSGEVDQIVTAILADMDRSPTDKAPPR